MPAEIYGPLGALAVLGFVVIALIRGDIVPGFIYKAEVTQRQRAELMADKNTEALSSLSKSAAEMMAAARARQKTSGST